MKKLKIIAAVILAASLSAGAAGISSFGADAEEYTIFVDSDRETAKAGDVVKVSVVLEPGAHISALTIELLYDAEFFEYQKDAAAGSGLRGGMPSINAKMPEKIILSYMTLGSLFNESNKKVLLTASFKVLKPGGQFTVFPETVGADDMDATDVTKHCVVKGKTIGAKDEAAKPEQPTKPEQTAKPEQTTKPDKPAKPDEADEAGKSENTGKAEESEKSSKPGETGETGRFDKQKEPESAATAAKTGQNFDIVIWVLIAALVIGSAVGIGSVIYLRKKK